MTPARSAEYLRTYGSPSAGSRLLTAEVIEELADGRSVRILDLGCGNGQMLELFRERRLDCDYTGVDFSDALLAAARARHGEDPVARFVAADIADLTELSAGYDIALYSHVLEMLAAPEAALGRARDLARHTVIRFFESPDHEIDVVELREMEIGDGTAVPYLRRKIARDSYRLMLSRLGVRAVDVYRDESSTDQVHVLHYA